MKIAIPTDQGRFVKKIEAGTVFTMLEIGIVSNQVLKKSEISLPPEKTGFFPCWLALQGVNVVFLAGLGSRLQERCEQVGVKVVKVEGKNDPKKIIKDWLNSNQF